MGVLDGKVALVTGGSRGIGRAVASRFAAEGAHVVISGRDPRHLADAAAAIGGDVTTVAGDVADLEALDRLYAVIADTAGHLDIVVANAAQGLSVPFEHVSPENFDAVFDVTARGVFFTVQKALPLLADDGAVILINTAIWRRGRPGSSVFSAAKSTLRSYARTWTSDLRARRIRVNVLSVSGIDTGIWERNAPSPQAAEAIKGAIVDATPLGRLGRPDEIAAAATFLASPAASFIAGAELVADGGFTAI